MNQAFKVLIVYESFEWGIRAKEMVARLVARTHPGFAIECDAWNFQLLSQPQLLHLATGRAATADMVILSAHRASQLPYHVKHWIQGWLPQPNTEAAALVAMFGEHEQTAAPLHTHLSQMAQMGGRDFFWHNERHATLSPSMSFEDDSAPAFVLEGEPNEINATRRWGINE